MIPYVLTWLYLSWHKPYKHFTIVGNDSYCMVHYATKHIYCIYDERDDCGDDLHNYPREAVVCFSYTDIKKHL